MNEDAVAKLLELGVAPALVGLLPDEVPFVLKESQGKRENLPPISARHDCEAALYVDRSCLWVALDPEDARRYEGLTGSKIAEPGDNKTTWRLIVHPEGVQQPDAVRHLREAVVSAITRSSKRPAGTPGTTSNGAAGKTAVLGWPVRVGRSGVRGPPQGRTIVEGDPVRPGRTRPALRSPQRPGVCAVTGSRTLACPPPLDGTCRRTWPPATGVRRLARTALPRRAPASDDGQRPGHCRSCAATPGEVLVRDSAGPTCRGREPPDGLRGSRRRWVTRAGRGVSRTGSGRRGCW